jgi:Cu-Zn family superoxide dismutase
MIENKTTSAITVAGVVLALALAAGPADAMKSKKVRASADIFTCEPNPQLIGTAALKEEQSDEGVKQVKVSIHVEGLPPGDHAVHIHETAACEPCGAAGGHFDPGPFGMSNPDGNHPFHSGDLVNIEVNGRGIGNLNVNTTRLTLSEGPLSVFDDDGSAVIIHVNPDTYCPDGAVPGCAGGGRAACGVIERE